MKRDYSQFMPSLAQRGTPQRTYSNLDKLGWQPFFMQQTSIEDMEVYSPARVTEVHRSHLHILGETLDLLIPSIPDIAVGDWVLYDEGKQRIHQLFERKSIFQRRAPGTDRKRQLIAANLDTVFIVTSCNHDFNIARLERYLALALEADVTPVIVLTKIDLCEKAEDYIHQAEAISDKTTVVSVNALSGDVLHVLEDWCKPGQTIGFLGSSGVGKSTLVNALHGIQTALTRSIRDDDSKGRHTTTNRHLYMLDNGCIVLDTPGMREIQLTNVETGIATLFEDLEELAASCRFTNCQHTTEPGCAIQSALAAGTINPARFLRWSKLLSEEKYNSASLAERRAKDKAFGKMVRTTMKIKNRHK